MDGDTGSAVRDAVVAGDIVTGTDVANCGLTGNGDFQIDVQSADLGTSPAAVACETVDSTSIQNTGVIFAAGC